MKICKKIWSTPNPSDLAETLSEVQSQEVQSQGVAIWAQLTRRSADHQAFFLKIWPLFLHFGESPNAVFFDFFLRESYLLPGFLR